MARKADFLSSEFIRTLWEKCFGYVLAAERLYDAHGKRIDTRDLVNEPIFRAVRYYRQFWLAREALQEDENQAAPVLGKWPSVEVDPQQTLLLTDKLLAAIGAADPTVLRRVADLMELNERAQAKYDFLRRPKDAVLPWGYYTARAALSFLADRTLPTREDVKDLAIKLRAGDSLPVRANTKALMEKIEELRKKAPKQWRRIFRELGLTNLPQR